VAPRADHARRKSVRFRPHAGYILANTIFAAVFVALVLSAFHAPSPHGLLVGIVAPARVTRQIQGTLNGHLPGGFDLRVYHGAASARAAITRHQVAGALIAGVGRLRLLIAQAGGTAPAQTLTQVFGAVAARTGQPLTVTDVVPPLASDTEALSPFFVVLGVLFPSLAAGSASALVFRRARPAWCVAAPVVVAIVIGAAVAGIADGVAGLGHYAAIAAIVALFSVAVAAPTATLVRIWPPLAVLALLAFLLFGIPVSGGPANLAQFTPGFMRVLHPALPLGAAASAVRNVVYFGGSGTAGPVWVLAAWAAAGVAALTLVATLRRPASAPHRRPPAQLATGLAGQSAAAVTGPATPVSLVVGFDNSAPARRALDWAVRRLRQRPGALHVVYADHMLIDSDLSGFGHAEMMAAEDRQAAKVAESAADILAPSGIRYTFEQRQGAPADALLSAAEDQAAADGTDPVIVVGRSGHAAHQVLGSVPVRLLHHSSYPVLTIA
jgi:nucleotide-binding universal stress UspA family protein